MRDTAMWLATRDAAGWEPGALPPCRFATALGRVVLQEGRTADILADVDGVLLAGLWTTQCSPDGQDGLGPGDPGHWQGGGLASGGDSARIGEVAAYLADCAACR